MQKFLRALIIVDLVLLVLLTTCSTPLLPRPLQSAARRVVPTNAPLPPTPRATTRPLRDVFAAASPMSTATILPSTTIAPTATLPPTPVPAPPPPELGLAIDRYMSDLLRANLFHGAILVARDGQVIISKGYGMADAERGIAITPQTRFRLASVSKQFTAMAIMLLQAQGKLNLQDSICAHLADCPDAWQPITIHNLLTHTSGLPNYTDFADFDATEMLPTTPDQLVARFRNLPLWFAPGTAYSYNNSGYLLLGLIIERASGQTYADFLRERIFEPLGMHDSGVDRNEVGLNQATGYRSFADKAPPFDTSTLFGCGGLYSSVEDMQRWSEALATDQLLPQPLRDQIFTPFMGEYGYGWKITHPNGRLRISHAGLMEGFANYIVRYPNDHITVIVLSNLAASDAPGIGEYLAGMVFGS